MSCQHPSTSVLDTAPVASTLHRVGRLRHERDLALVRRVLARDHAATDEFLQRMRCVEGFVVALNRRCGALLDQESLRDVTQDVLASVWSKLSGYRGEAALRSWVFRFCELRVRKVSRGLRLRRVQPLLSDVVDSREVVDGGVAGRQVVDETLATLVPDDARILRLKLFEALTFADIAVRTATMPSTVKTRYYRALARLRTVPSCLTRGQRCAV